LVLFNDFSKTLPIGVRPPVYNDGIDTEIAQMTQTSKWPTPCEEEFDHLSSSHPELLLEWVKSDVLTNAQLSMAAPFLSRTCEGLATLVKLMEHESPMVREGALYGLSSLHDQIDCIVGYHMDGDASPAVRSTAKELWEKWGGE
jgi:hypothetical protein